MWIMKPAGSSRGRGIQAGSIRLFAYRRVACWVLAWLPYFEDVVTAQIRIVRILHLKRDSRQIARRLACAEL